MENKDNNIKKEIEKRNKTLRTLRTFMLVIDILSIILLIFQIVLGSVLYSSYVILIICNLIVFLVKIDSKKSNNMM